MCAPELCAIRMCSSVLELCESSSTWLLASKSKPNQRTLTPACTLATEEFRRTLTIQLILPIIFMLAFNAHANPISINNISLIDSSSSAYNSTYESFKNNGFKPRKDVDFWPISFPINWSEDPFNDRNWMFQLYSWRLIDAVLLEYDETKHQSLLKESIAIILDWYEFHVVKGKNSVWTWYDMSTGLRAMKLAWIWQEIMQVNLEISNDTKERIYHLMELHVEKLMDESFLSRGNHAYFQLVGLRLICISEASLKACEEEAAYGKRKMDALIGKQFTEQGVHREHSPRYHLLLVNELQNLNIYELYPLEIDGFANKIEEVIPWLIYPDSTVARIGDSSGKSNITFSETPKIHTVNDRHILIGDFIASGYFTVRTNLETSLNESTQIFISGMSNKNSGHKHADELSFELFHKGKLVIVDSGKYSYNKDGYRNYIISAKAHNTLSIDGVEIKPYDVSDSGSKLTPYTIQHEEVIVSGNVNRPDLFSHHREFRITPFETMEIQDVFDSQMPNLSKVSEESDVRSFTSNLHINPELSLQRISSNIVRINNYIEVELLSNECELFVIYGQTNPLLGWISFSYNEIQPTSVLQAKCPLDTGELTWDITLL